MTPQEQLEKWVDGESCHDYEANRCVPDFSCCYPKLLAPVEDRQLFGNADSETRLKMMMEFIKKFQESRQNSSDG